MLVNPTQVRDLLGHPVDENEEEASNSLKLSNSGVTSSYFKFVALAMLNVSLCAVGR